MWHCVGGGGRPPLKERRKGYSSELQLTSRGIQFLICDCKLIDFVFATLIEAEPVLKTCVYQGSGSWKFHSAGSNIHLDFSGTATSPANILLIRSRKPSIRKAAALVRST